MVAALARQFGDLDVAEEATADAFASAVERWRSDGIPPNPGGWLTTTARRKAIDRLRREGRRTERQSLAGQDHQSSPLEPDEPVDDARLRLLFICCQPTLPSHNCVALTLRMVGGLSVDEIARAFLVRPSTMGQRISRAKAQVRASGVPFRMPDAVDMAARLNDVLSVLYLIFNEGYLATGAHGEPLRDELVDDGIRIARLLHADLPNDGEVAGLLALMLFAAARRTTRIGPDGALVPLPAQDRRAWDHAMIGEADRMVERAWRRGTPGRYLIQAAISAVHASADDALRTDWKQIVALYEQLERIDPSPIVSLNRAVAVAELGSLESAIGIMARIEGPLADYHAFFAVRADLRRRLGQVDAARQDYDRAIALAENRAERAFLEQRRRDLLRDA